MISNGVLLCFIFYLCLNLISQITCMSLYQCKFGEYWHTVLERCRTCSDICVPLTRSTCTSRCKDFYRYVRVSARTTTTTAEQYITTNVGTSAHDTNNHPNHLATGLICLAVISVLIFSISVIVLLISKKKSIFGCLRRITKVLIRRTTEADQQVTNPDNIGPEQPMIVCEQPRLHEIKVDAANVSDGTDQRSGGGGAVDANVSDGTNQHTGSRNRSWQGTAVYEEDNNVLRVQGLEQLPFFTM